jgi:ATP-binding cassette, subfamily B, bacterial PglK
MLQTIRRMLTLLNPRERRLLALQFAMLVAIAFIDLLGIASILPFMAVVSKPEVIHTNQWLVRVHDLLGFNDTQTFLVFLGSMVLGLLVLGNVVKAIYTWYSLRYDNALNYHLASRLLASYMARPYEFFLNSNTAEMGKNVLSECGAVIAGILSPSMQIVANFLLCSFVVALLLAVDPFIAIAIVVVLGGAYGTIYLLARRRLVTIGEEQVNANFFKYRAAGEALSGIKDLKILGRERDFLDKFSVHARHHARCNASAGTIAQLPRFALETVAFGGILLIVLYSLNSDRQVDKIVPLLSLYAFAGYRLMPALQQLFASISAVRVNWPALDMLYRNMTQGRVAANIDAILPDNQMVPRLPFVHELALRNVTFHYQGASNPAIRNVDLVIKPNTSIGLVGATGSGKTTAVDLILGLLTPSAGSLTVDGVEIDATNVARWQRNLGYVPQQIYLSDDTVASNIAFGVPEDQIVMADVIRAARVANLHAFVERALPEKYQTVIGERGIRLSGGERQRIGIARALYRDPSVLIMDEATSALDGITEEAVMDALHTLTGQKTVIMIAHRLTTVKECDVIYLMEHGRVVNSGRYDDLLQSSTWFQTVAGTTR